MKRQMHLGLFILGTGSHVAGWRYPGAVDSFQDFPAIRRIGQTAERGKFDLIFMGDNLYADAQAHPSYTLRLEPLTMLAALSTRPGTSGSAPPSPPPIAIRSRWRACSPRSITSARVAPPGTQ